MRTLAVVAALVMGGAVLTNPGVARAQSARAGSTVNAIGAVVIVRSDGIESRVRGKEAIQLFEGDLVKTDPGSQALVELGRGTSVALNENTLLKIISRWEKDKGVTQILRLREGEIWVKTGEAPKALEVETPVAAAVVRQTEFNIKVLPDGQTVLTVVEGVVEFGTAFGTCPIRTSTVSYGVRGKRCTRPEAIDAATATAWNRAVLAR